jgi:uncharacterized membrane protein
MQVFKSAFPTRLLQLTAISAIGLFLCSSFKHHLLSSNAYDLGYFDQAIYLISQGQEPIVSFWGYHFLGGHADWILYPIALLYKLWPTVQWLFAIQAMALASGHLGAWMLATQAGLKGLEAWAIVFAYGLYPLVFNLNLFDFHPEVIALPLLMVAVWAARADRLWLYASVLIVILGCRDALSITVAAMGVWLWFFEKRRRAGALAVLWGTGWFVIATQLVIPHFRPGGVESVARYALLGASLSEVITNLFLKPNLVLGQIFTGETIGYFALLFLPMFWALRGRFLAPMVVAIPTLLINILSKEAAQRDLVHQYSLPILPFMLIAGIACLSAGQPILLKRPKWIIAWSLFGFLCLAKYSYFGWRYLEYQDNAAEVHHAVAQVPNSAKVLTHSNIASHLMHRSLIHLTDVKAIDRLKTVSYTHVLLNLRHPGFAGTPEISQKLLSLMKEDRSFELQSVENDIYLFVRRDSQN